MKSVLKTPKNQTRFCEICTNNLEIERREIESGEIVGGGFGTADHLEGAVGLQKDLGGAELAVVVVAHGEAVGAGVVDGYDVANLDLRQAALNGELVVVLSQAAGDVVDVIQNGVLLAEDGDVMVSTVHGGAHQVSGASIQTHILPVDVLLMQHRGDQVAVGR